MVYRIRCRETGDAIEDCDSFVEAMRLLHQYIDADKSDGTYTPDFYEVYFTGFVVVELRGGEEVAVGTFETAYSACAYVAEHAGPSVLEIRTRFFFDEEGGIVSYDVVDTCEVVA